ncbi:MAG: hypothetical protein JNM84_26015 [Planctomycetes bacterium]|nr:hypothetical protein [Planctomycetota bacterium]
MRIGSASQPLEFVIPAGSPEWKLKGNRSSWKGRNGLSLVLDQDLLKLTLKLKKAELGSQTLDPFLIEAEFGPDCLSSIQPWPSLGNGRYRW